MSCVTCLSLQCTGQCGGLGYFSAVLDRPLGGCGGEGLEISPAELYFGTMVVGESDFTPRTITVTNSGASPIGILGVNIAVGGLYFSLVGNTSYPGTLAPGASFDIDVRASLASTAGRVAGQIEIRTNEARMTYSIGLSARVIAGSTWDSSLTAIYQDFAALVQQETWARTGADFAEAGHRLSLEARLATDINAKIVLEQITRVTQFSAEAVVRTQMDVRLTDAITAGLLQEQIVRASLFAAEAGTRTIMEASIRGDYNAKITNEKLARVTGFAATATDIQTLTVSFNQGIANTNASITDESSARATSIASEANRVNGIVAQLTQIGGTIDTRISASATTEVTARLTAIAAEALRVDMLVASFDTKASVNTKVNAAITTQEAVRSAAHSAAVDRIITLEATVTGGSNGGIDSFARGAIVTEEQVRASQVLAQATRTTKLIASISNPVSLNPDQNFNNLDEFWEMTGVVPVDGSHSSYRAIESNTLGNPSLFSKSRFPVDLSKTYRIKGRSKRSATGNGTFFLVVRAFDAANLEIQVDGSYFYYPLSAPLTTEFVEFNVAFGLGQVRIFPANAVTWSIGVLLNYNSTAGSQTVEQLRVEDFTAQQTSSALVSQEAMTRVEQLAALATRSSNLEAAVASPTSGNLVLRARIQAEEETRAGDQTALALRSTNLETAVASPTSGNLALKARIQAEEETRASVDTATASQFVTVSANIVVAGKTANWPDITGAGRPESNATVNRPGDEMNRNSSFEFADANGLLTGWTFGGPNLFFQQQAVALGRGAKAVFIVRPTVFYSEPVPCAPGETLWVEYSFAMNTGRNGAQPGTPAVITLSANFSADGTTNATNGATAYHTDNALGGLTAVSMGVAQIVVPTGVNTVFLVGSLDTPAGGPVSGSLAGVWIGHFAVSRRAPQADVTSQNTAANSNALGGVPSATLLGNVTQNSANITLERNARVAEYNAFAGEVATVKTRLGNAEAGVTQTALSIDGVAARHSVELDVNGYGSGFVQHNSGARSDAIWRADTFKIINPGFSPEVVFEVTDGETRMRRAIIGTANIGTQNIAPAAVSSSAAITDTTVYTGGAVPANGASLTIANPNGSPITILAYTDVNGHDSTTYDFMVYRLVRIQSNVVTPITAFRVGNADTGGNIIALDIPVSGIPVTYRFEYKMAGGTGATSGGMKTQTIITMELKR